MKKTINIEYNDYTFLASYTFSEGEPGDYLNAPEGHEVNVLSVEFEYSRNNFLEAILFPPEAFIIEQILEFETNL